MLISTQESDPPSIAQQVKVLDSLGMISKVSGLKDTQETLNDIFAVVVFLKIAEPEGAEA